MKLKLVISKFSIKEQLYNGIKPTKNHILTKKLVNALFSKRWIIVPLDGKQLYKIYIENKHYRTVVYKNPNVEDSYTLIYFRSKDDPASENIADYQNYSKQVLRTNEKKITECIKNKQFTILEFEK